jgi:glyoxylase-like metal-dependent hydrolase (beta-lactamase superfamily II)
MFDSGYGALDNIGAIPTAGRLADNAKAAGIDMSKLTAIAVTHFHPDHIFGLFDKNNAQVFENIEIVVPEAEYKFWADPAVIDKLPPARQGIAKRVQATMPNWKNLRQVAADKDVVAGVRAVATPGHSPGHTSYLVSEGSAQMMVLGDLSNIPAFNMKNPGWHIVFDQDGPLAEKSRRETFDRVVADKIACTGYHWGMPGIGTISKDGAGYALVPAA